MPFRHSFGILGGDKRQLFLAELLASDGYEVFVYGFPHIDFVHSSIQKVDLKATLEYCRDLILPLPVSTDGKNLKAIYADGPIPLDDHFAKECEGHRVYVGMKERLLKTSPFWENADVRDYNAQEEFAVRNAAITAESAVGIAISESPDVLYHSRCLVVGFGRIGKQLSLRLKAMGANVSVCARKEKDYAMIESLGMKPIPTAKIGEETSFDLIFNTVPAVLFDRRVLQQFANTIILIDLGSSPGGVDLEAAKELGIHAVQALSLPAKIAPKAAGKVIQQTIYMMMGE